MDTTDSDFVLAGSLKELKAKGRLVVHGRHRPVLLVHEGGHVFALDNRCPHMGFPLDRGSVEDGIPTRQSSRTSSVRSAATGTPSATRWRCCEIAVGDFAGLDDAKAEPAAMTLLGREGPAVTALGRAVLPKGECPLTAVTFNPASERRLAPPGWR